MTTIRVYPISERLQELAREVAAEMQRHEDWAAESEEGAFEIRDSFDAHVDAALSADGPTELGRL